MVTRIPLVLIDGRPSQLPAGDVLPGGGGAVAWGAITGDPTDQADLAGYIYDQIVASMPIVTAGAVDTVFGNIVAGTGVTFSGTGTLGDPYVVNATGGGGLSIIDGNGPSGTPAGFILDGNG